MILSTNLKTLYELNKYKSIVVSDLFYIIL